MPLLYRILMRLGVVTTVLGVVLGLLLIISGGSAPIPDYFVLIVALLPGAALYVLAWIVRPPLDRASLRRLWRD